MTTPDTFRIQPATEQDVPLILRFITELAAYEKLAHEVTATEATLRESLFGPRPAADVLLAFVNDEPVGFAVFFRTFSTFLGRPGIYLEDLYVTPACRGRGLGRKLLAAVARAAVAEGDGRMEWSVLDWNELAIGFYKKIGAQLMDDWTICRLSGDALKRLAAAK
jgi:GNAT superfamily N-acetyltransferase